MANSSTDSNALFSFLQSCAVAPAHAHQKAHSYRQKADKKYAGGSDAQKRDAAARQLVASYCRLAAGVGGTTALAGVVPGAGTAVSALVGGLADTGFCMKLQLDMVMCLAALYGYDLHSPEVRNLAILVALGAAVEHTASERVVPIASKAGVRLLKRHLRGSALKTMKHLCKQVGLNFQRKALEKAIPFGVGAAISATFNYGITRFVGNQAIKVLAQKVI